MRKSFRVYKLAFLALLGLGLQSCHKENDINNNNVIKKPYGLYIGDQQGAVWNTNTGDSIRPVFFPDGFPARSIVTAGENLIFVKMNTHLSTNNGENFNPVDSSVVKNALWQTLMLNSTDHGRVYLCNAGPKKGKPSKGIIYSEDYGKTWVADTMWRDTIKSVSTTSITQLKDNTLFSFDHVSKKLFIRTGKNVSWEQVTMNGLPSDPISTFYLSHYGNILLLTDYAGSQGVWHSEDRGKNWAQYPGLPKGGRLYATNAPFDQDLLVGTDVGVYRLKAGTFIPSNNGLTTNTAVRAIVGKDDKYKNDVVKQYYYLGTSTGLYRSEDFGENWILTRSGDYSALY